MNFHFLRSYRGPIKAVILDWAGTTVDYGCCAPAVVFVDVFKRHGVAITTAEARAPMGAEKRQHILEIARMPRVADAWASAHGNPCTNSDVDTMYAEFVPLQIACLKDYAELIPGTLDAVKEFERHGIAIGSTSGYNRAMMDTLVPLAAKQGYAPCSVVSASEVPKGRPAPWMALKSAEQMNVYPLEAIVKIGDTVPDIEEGLNAGMWSVGVAKTGNEVGLNEAEIAQFDAADLERRVVHARERLARAGAHYVIDGIGDIPAVLDAIERSLASGERP
jgi:phosphonoacetaldehyde hydrolase